MLALVEANLSQQEAERSYGVAEVDLAPSVDWSAYGLRKEWNARRDGTAPWWGENSKEAYASGCADLARALGTVVVENLHVAGMLRNRRLARRIADAAFGEIRRQLEYKTAWNGGNLVVADRWLPSSKTCSACGVVQAKLRLSERIFTCEHCAAVLDRDLNAAYNLRNLVKRAAVDLA